MTAQITAKPVSPALQWPAKFISYLLHPLFIPSIIFFWLLWRFPYMFAGITAKALWARKINVIWTTAFFPAFAVFLMWRLKFIDSIFLRTARERIGAFIITMIFYWWMWYLSRNFTDQPSVLKFFYFGIFLTTVLGLIINNFIKISLHTIGAGSAASFILITSFFYQIYLGADIAAATILAGIIGTARLVCGTHTTTEIYAGYIVGVVCQVAAFYAMM